jgi:hypothetical protein
MGYRAAIPLVCVFVGLLLMNLFPGLQPVEVTTAASTTGYLDMPFYYKPLNASAPLVQTPTGEKPQSKLWYNDGRWWASLFNTTSGNYHIYWLNLTYQTWIDTGTVLDTRAETKADCLWDGTYLYVVSGGGADLSGAELEGASLDNADLATAIVDRVAPRPTTRPALAGAAAVADVGLPMGRGGATTWPRRQSLSLPGGLTLPQVSTRVLLMTFAAILAFLQLWGWRYRTSYLLDGFGLRQQVPGLVTATQSANLRSGLLDVLPILLKLALGLPLLVLGLLVVVGLIVLPILLLWRFGERVLADIVRPAWRPVLVGGLFLAYTALFVLILIPGVLRLGSWAMNSGLPGTGVLGLLKGLLFTGGFFGRSALVLTLAGLLWPLLLLARHLGVALRAWEPPVAWRLRYPVLNSAATHLRASQALARLRPLNGEERRRGQVAAAALLLVLASLIAGAGRVQAQSDMCDGGNLPRVLLYLGEREPRGGSICQRLLAETNDHVYTFFPSQTSIGEGAALRHTNVREIEKVKGLTMVTLPAVGGNCPTCATGSDGSEVAVVDPDELKAEGPIAEVAGRVITLDVAPGEGVFDSVVVADGTEILVDGVPAAIDALATGQRIVAFGRSDPTAPTKLNARQVSVVVARGPLDKQGGTVAVDLSNPWTPIFSGSGWDPGSQLQVRLVDQAQVLAKDFGGRGGINVNVVAPGVTTVGMARASVDAGKYDAMIDRGVISRFGRPEDVARAVRLLIDPDGYITGQVIVVDGGLTLRRDC